MLPAHPAEIDRLDLQHYALRMALQGNYVAPVPDAGRILDVGSGTGQWAYDLCDEFPAALVVGLDIKIGKPDQPPNYRHVRGDVRRRLPFADGAFDFVHQRLMQPAIPLELWTREVGELLRVTRQSGVVELMEIGDRWEPAGPAIRALWKLSGRLAAMFGVDGGRIVPGSLDAYLRHAGAVDVQRHHVAIPIGAWGGAVGSMLAADVRALFTGLLDRLETRLAVARAESTELLAAALQECETLRSNAICTYAHGRRP